MSQATCSVEGCERPRRKRGWCGRHYQAERRRGLANLPALTAAERFRSKVDRFWSKIDRSGGPDACWPWTAGYDPNGYGQFRSDGKLLLAHRVAWELTNGPVPEGEGYHGTCVLHRCDSPSCCNPAHLFLGTQADNLADMAAKGRRRGGGPPGERNGQAKLTSADAAEIRRRYARGGVLQRELAVEFSVNRPAISAVVTHRNWRHAADDG